MTLGALDHTMQEFSYSNRSVIFLLGDFRCSEVYRLKHSKNYLEKAQGGTKEVALFYGQFAVAATEVPVPA